MRPTASQVSRCSCCVARPTQCSVPACTCSRVVGSTGSTAPMTSPRSVAVSTMPAPASNSASNGAASPTGSRPSVSASRRQVCCSRSGATADRWNCATRIATRSTIATARCRWWRCAVATTSCSICRRPTTSTTGSPRSVNSAVSTPGSSSPRCRTIRSRCTTTRRPSTASGFAPPRRFGCRPTAS